MKIVKPQKVGVLYRSYEDGRRCHLSVGLLVFFSLRGTRQVLSEISMWKFLAEELGPQAALDAGMPKPHGEVLLSARCFAPNGQPVQRCAVAVELGSLRKELHVVGDRVWTLGGASEPVPFVELPIVYERAYGGPGYAANPVGKGHRPLVAAQGGEQPLPNIEEPRQQVSSAYSEVPPAGFGPLDILWPQRASKAGTYDQRWFQTRFPGFAADMDPSIFNAAPEDQQITGFFRGDESFVLQNLHSREPLLTGRLPSLRGRCFITTAPDAASVPVLREVPTQLETVWLFPHAERGVLIFRGVAPIAEDDAADVRQLVAACEAMESPRSVEHYQQVLAERLDKERGHLYALRDRDLLPELPPTPSDPADEQAAFAAMVQTAGLAQRNMQRGAERQRQEAWMRAAAMGFDADSLYPKEQIPEPPPPPQDLGQLPAYVEQVDAWTDKQSAELLAKKAEAEAQLRKTCAELGISYEDVTSAQAGGPPSFSAEEELRKLRSLRSEVIAGESISELAPLLGDPDLPDRLRHAEQRLREAYVQNAHYFPPAPFVSAERSQKLRQELSRGRNAAGQDLTGADLSGLDLSGYDLSGALLERANLRGSCLTGANLQGAVLARCDLSQADLRRCDLRKANVGAAVLYEARLDQADLRGAILSKARLEHVSLRGVQLADAELLETQLHDVDLSDAVAPKLLFLRTDLHEVTATAAQLTEALFIEAQLRNCHFAQADLSKAVFVTVQGDGSSFSGANLQSLRVVKDSSFANSDFSGSNLTGANLRGTQLSHSRFCEAQLSEADLSECGLMACDFSRTAAVAARFVRANLSGAVLRSANLLNAILQKATAYGATFENASLFRADLSQIKQDATTLFAGANMVQARTEPRARDERRP